MMQYNRSMKQSERLEIRLGPDMLLRLRSAAEQDGRSVSNLARRLLATALGADTRPIDDQEEA
jgi:hypothetical protein